MRAVRWHGNRDVRVEETSLRLPLTGTTVEIDVSLCGICGSDIAEFRDGPFAMRARPHPLTGQGAPVTMGHEIVGRVSDTGQDVTAVRRGQRVTVDACWRCGRCPACLDGRYNHCELGGSIGFASDGGFAAKVRVPDYCVVPVPEALDDRSAAAVEPFAVALHALERGGVAAGTQIAVLGFGPIGAAAADMARALGAHPLVVETSQERRALAAGLGHEVVTEDDPARTAKAVRALSGGGVPLVVDATGAPEAVEAGLAMTSRGGVVVLAGVPKRRLSIDPVQLFMYERSLVASLGYRHDLPRVVRMAAAGQIDLARIITRTVGLEELPEELDRLSSGPGADLKVLVDVAR
jgi:(R,R)-butanediol dehydrogenase/meso-butanediol dehydrogenase/diacetyl reductase